MNISAASLVAPNLSSSNFNFNSSANFISNNSSSNAHNTSNNNNPKISELYPVHTNGTLADLPPLQQLNLSSSRPFESSLLPSLSGIWSGSSTPFSQPNQATTWTDCRLNFLEDGTLSGTGHSVWRNETIHFILVGTVHCSNATFELFKTHTGKYTNTIVYNGVVKIDCWPFHLEGQYRSGQLILTRNADLNNNIPKQPELLIQQQQPQQIVATQNLLPKPLNSDISSFALQNPVSSAMVNTDNKLVVDAWTNAVQHAASPNPTAATGVPKPVALSNVGRSTSAPVSVAEPTSQSTLQVASSLFPTTAARKTSVNSNINNNSNLSSTALGLLSGLWQGISLQKSAGSTKWTDTVIQFHFQGGNNSKEGTIRGYGIQVSRGINRSFRLNGSFDLNHNGGIAHLTTQTVISLDKQTEIQHYTLKLDVQQLTMTGEFGNGGKLVLSHSKKYPKQLPPPPEDLPDLLPEQQSQTIHSASANTTPRLSISEQPGTVDLSSLHSSLPTAHPAPNIMMPLMVAMHSNLPAAIHSSFAHGVHQQQQYSALVQASKHNNNVNINAMSTVNPHTVMVPVPSHSSSSAIHAQHHANQHPAAVYPQQPLLQTTPFQPHTYTNNPPPLSTSISLPISANPTQSGVGYRRAATVNSVLNYSSPLVSNPNANASNYPSSNIYTMNNPNNTNNPYPAPIPNSHLIPPPLATVSTSVTFPDALFRRSSSLETCSSSGGLLSPSSESECGDEVAAELELELKGEPQEGKAYGHIINKPEGRRQIKHERAEGEEIPKLSARLSLPRQNSSGKNSNNNNNNSNNNLGSVNSEQKVESQSNNNVQSTPRISVQPPQYDAEAAAAEKYSLLLAGIVLANKLTPEQQQALAALSSIDDAQQSVEVLNKLGLINSNSPLHTPTANSLSPLQVNTNNLSQRPSTANTPNHNSLVTQQHQFSNVSTPSHSSNSALSELTREITTLAKQSSLERLKAVAAAAAAAAAATTNTVENINNALLINQQAFSSAHCHASAPVSGFKPISEPSEADLCKVCFDSVSNTILLPCGHIVCCMDCSRQLRECPICRQLITEAKLFYKA